MSREYAENRIREALKMTGGHQMKARQQVIAWTYEDPKLLHELTRPHMTGIVAHAVSRVSLRMAEPEEEIPEAPKAERRPLKKQQDRETDAFGRDLLKALSHGDPAVFGQESFSPQMRRGKASQRHIDALKMMSSKGKSVK